jgi:hypothetical protein
MEVNFENASLDEDIIYEGVLSSDDEGNYWINQNQRSVRLDITKLDEQILEERDGDVISVVGNLGYERRDGSSVLDYELEALTVAELEGFNPVNNTYVSRLGDVLMEAYSNSINEFEGDTEDLVDTFDTIAY